MPDASDNYEERIRHASAISHPLSSKKLTKKLYKSVHKASKHAKKSVKRGVKEVVKSLRKGGKGVVLIAADIYPIDVISHLAVLCEDAGVKYVYVPSKEDLGSAGSTKRPTSCVLIGDDVDGFADLEAELKVLNEKVATK